MTTRDRSTLDQKPVQRIAFHPWPYLEVLSTAVLLGGLLFVPAWMTP